MILAMYVAITAFRAAAESAFSPIKGALERLFRVQYPTGPFKDREYLYQRIQKIRVIKYIGKNFHVS